NAVVQDDGLKLDGHFGDRLRMTEEEITAWFEDRVEVLNELAATLFGEIDENVHAKDDVHLSDVNAVAEIHLNKIDHLAKPRTDLLTTFSWLKMSGELPFADARDAAAGIHPAFSNGQGLAAYVGRENLDTPGL